MKKLVDGVIKFQDEIFPARRDLFRKLASNQSPQALIITCSDSRIVPDMLMQCEPGDLFICRNAGNIIPPWGDMTGGVTATIEYAVMALGIKNIIVCGHSDCGAMRAILHPEKVKDLPAVRNWLMNAERPRRLVQDHYAQLAPAEQLHVLTEENVLAQLDNLRTHPSVASRLAAGDLKLYGWVYNIETGHIHTYDLEHEQFVPLRSADQDATPRQRTRRPQLATQAT
jgi:carbonic anhydrase